MVCVTCAGTFNRSRVDRTSRSRRVTISTSPASSLPRSLASSARSVLAPLAFSRYTLAQPAVSSFLLLLCLPTCAI